jgi:tetratricopeptide (TPR) repeat protein
MFDFSRAIVDFNKVLELDSTNRVALFYRALAKLEQSDFGGAIDDMESLLDDDPNNSELHYQLGIANIRSGKINQGCYHLTVAKNLGDSRVDQHLRDRCAFYKEED